MGQQATDNGLFGRDKYPFLLPPTIGGNECRK